MFTDASWVRRFLVGFFVFVLVRGIFLWLGMVGIHPEVWVASMLNWAAEPGVLSAIAWTIAGLAGLAGLIFWPRIAPMFHSSKKRGGSIPMREAALIAFDDLEGTMWREAADKW